MAWNTARRALTKIGRIRELQADIQPKLKEVAVLEKIASGDIDGPWDDHEKISKCVQCEEYDDEDDEE